MLSLIHIYAVTTADSTYESRYCIISVGRSGSKWMEKVCNDLDIPTKSNRVDIGCLLYTSRCV